MKNKTNRLLVIVFCLFSILAWSEWSMAAVNYDVVVDSNNNFVRDEQLNCVRTKWQTPNDPCEETQVAYVSKIEEYMRINLYFAFDESYLSDSEKEKLLQTVNLIKKQKVTGIKIYGYADRIGTDDYNYLLSLKRAVAVRDFMDMHLKPGKQLYEIKGLGRTNQVSTCSKVVERDALIKCLAPNRRTEVEVVIYHEAS